MAQMLLALFAIALMLPSGARGQKAIDFSGNWKMDASRSESAHQAVPNGPVTLVIKQTAGNISIETRRSESGKGANISESLTYKLDGTETTAAGRDGVAVRAKAHWEGSQLVTETARNIRDSSVTTKDIYTLDLSGKEMTVRKTLTVQHGYDFEGAKNTGTGTDVFVRTKAAAAK